MSQLIAEYHNKSQSSSVPSQKKQHHNKLKITLASAFVSTKMADWSMLPSDILGEIASKLDQLEDFVYFSAVCHSWKDASSLVKGNWNAEPWLLLAENTNENPECVRKIYSPSNNRCYRSKLPETFGARCWGTPYGWIVMQTYDCQLHLFNPLTKVRITNLPSLLSLSHQTTNGDPLDDLEWFFRFFVHRIVVLKIPTPCSSSQPDDDDDGHLVVAVMYGEWYYLALARLGDQAWTDLDIKWVVDVECWGEHMYILRELESLQYCNIKGGISDFNDVKFVDYAPFPFTHTFWGSDRIYLLNMGGNLLMVYRGKEELNDNGSDSSTNEDEDEDEDEDDEGAYNFKIHRRTIDFEIYRLNSKSKKWVKINDIGNFSILVGTNSTLSIPILKANNYKANSIYFTDDQVDNSDLGFGGVDMGVYNMDSRDITKFYEGDDMDSTFCPPIFFVPKC